MMQNEKENKNVNMAKKVSKVAEWERRKKKSPLTIQLMPKAAGNTSTPNVLNHS
jgi:hypothetical protein